MVARKVAQARILFKKYYHNDDRFTQLHIYRRRLQKIIREGIRKMQKWYSQSLKDMTRAL